ncbi:hypothetical protein [Paenibacillus radicis (ex Xue et al. 2023)]|uniref:Uncharacterized protein n=1 Tax=Paenibacillus radicis (ex Xue et al. 2023) TaxID=2972489 RepID=A0ABT1YJ93_9BACL|nr:hypothetical protein [Paenibacillus radicis (ex Xue et al. 2023)]MCR8633247.1 hypothetical protein [Paenibacillus radicis (ex Xue et al. 2023)]
MHLTKAFDSYTNNNYDSAYSSLHMAYSHMFMTGAVLSRAIVTQFNEKFHDSEAMVTSPKVWMQLGSKVKVILKDVPLKFRFTLP